MLLHNLSCMGAQLGVFMTCKSSIRVQLSWKEVSSKNMPFFLVCAGCAAFLIYCVGECYNPPTNFSFLPSSESPSMQPLAQIPPAIPPPQPISTAPAPASPAQSASPSQPAPLAFNPFHTSYTPLYHITDFYEHPQGYAQLQQPLGSLHHQPLFFLFFFWN